MRKIFALASLVVMTQLSAVDVCFFATKNASAEYFSELVKVLDDKKISWEIFATDEAETFFKNHKICFKKLSVWMPKKSVMELSYDDVVAVAKLAAKECKKAKIVITESGESLVSRFHYELALISSAHRWVFHPTNYSLAQADPLLKTKPEGIIYNHKDDSHELKHRDQVFSISKKDFFNSLAELANGFSAEEFKIKVLG